LLQTSNDKYGGVFKRGKTQLDQKENPKERKREKNKKEGKIENRDKEA
jgi:hypothetical protein